MTQILLVGTDEPLLEGLAQSLGAAGHSVRVAHSIEHARENAQASAPLVAVVDRDIAATASASGATLGLVLAPGGAIVLFHSAESDSVTLPHALLRHVLADLTLPLERNRLFALASSVKERAKASGRVRDSGPNQEIRG